MQETCWNGASFAAGKVLPKKKSLSGVGYARDSGAAGGAPCRKVEIGRTSKSRCNQAHTYLLRHGLVDRSPPDLVLRRRLLDNTLVGWRTAGLSTRVRGQGTAGCDGSSGLVDESIFVEGSNRGVGNL